MKEVKEVNEGKSLTAKQDNKHLGALYAGLIFASHPVHVEAVTGKPSITNSLFRFDPSGPRAFS